VHRQERGRALGHRRGRRLRIEVQRARIDVGEDRPGALVEHDVGAGHERERRRDDLVPVRHADRAQREVQPGRAARHRARVLHADPRREGLLEGGHARPQRELARAQHVDDRRLLLGPEGRLGERDDVGGDRHAASVGAGCERRLRPGCSA
jgi:hypothetical protein